MITLIFDPLGNTGSHTIFATGYDSQGQELVREITFDVKALDIDFSLDYLLEEDKEMFFSQGVDLKAIVEPIYFNPNNPTSFEATLGIDGVNGYIILNTEIYRNGDKIIIEKGTTNFKFFSDDNKDVNTRISLSIADNYNNKDSAEINVLVKKIDYEVSMNTTAPEEGIFFTDTAYGEIMLEAIFDVEGELAPTYEATLTIPEDNGYIVIDNVEYKTGDLIEIEKGVTAYEYHPKENADKNVPMTLDFVDSYGLEKSTSITFNIKSIGYVFEMESLTEEIFYNEIATIRYNLTADTNSEADDAPTYKATVKLSGGEGIVTIDGVDYLDGDQVDIAPGEKDIQFKMTKYLNSSINIGLEAIDSYGLEKNDNVSIQIKQREFNFSASINGESLIYLGEERGKIQCNINVTGSSNGIDYFVTPVSTGQGKFYYNGESYENGESIQVVAGVFELEYEALNYNDGNHSIGLVGSDSTEQSQSTNVQFGIYKNPEVIEGSVRTWYYNDNKQSNPCGSCCRRNHHYMIKFDYELNNGSELKEYRLVFTETNGQLTTRDGVFSDTSMNDGFYEIFGQRYCSSSSWNANNLPFDLYIKDSNNNEAKVYSGIFTYDKDDNQ